MEDSEKIYNLTRNLNPTSVLADISVLAQEGPAKGLPVVRAETEECQGILSEPHFFDVVIASFVLDQLDPEQVRNSVIALENLLAKPTQIAKPTKETSSNYPLLIIASPEHAPIATSRFDRVILQEVGGYVPVFQEFLTSELMREKRQGIEAECGKDTLAAIEVLACKPFHLSIYAKTREADIEKLNKEPEESLVIKRGHPRKRTNGDKSKKLTQGLNPERLDALDVLSKLKASDFKASSCEPISRDAIANDPQYAHFEERLACLIYFKDYLTSAEKARLDMVVELWDKHQAQFLSKEQVDFVMNQPERTMVGYSRLPSHLQGQIDKEHKPILDSVERKKIAANLDEDKVQAAVDARRKELQRQKYLLSEVYQRECKYRRESGQRSVFELTRAILGQRVRMIREAIERGKRTKNELIEEVKLPWSEIERCCSEYGYELNLPSDFTVANNIRELMQRKGYGKSLSKLVEEMKKAAEELGVDTNINVSRVSGWIDRDCKPNPDDLKLLAKVFGVKESDIVPILQPSVNFA